MVRTIRAVPFPAAEPVRPQRAAPRKPLQHARIAAWSTALAVHVLALLLLLVPATYVAAPLPRDTSLQVRWIVPAPTPPVPPPIQTAAPLPPTAPTAVSHALPAPLPAPVAQLQTPAIALPATEAVPALPVAPVEPSAAPAAGATLRYRSAPPPAYPLAALRSGEQGTVLLRVEVAADGRPTAVAVERSSGSRALDQAARQQVLRRWQFVPAMAEGQPVAAIGLVPISFALPR